MSILKNPFSRSEWNVDDIKDQTGKVILITGANSGIGFESSKQLSMKGAKIVMACRNLEKAKSAKSEIIESDPSIDLDIMHIDLANLESVRSFSQSFLKKYNRLDVLINNAGIFHAPQSKTEDGFELHFGVNHLGHFLLTNLLFERLVETEGSKVITVTSVGYKMGEIKFDDINLEANYTKSKGYTQSKLANVLFGIELRRKIDESDVDVQSILAHPGITKSEIYNNASKMNKLSLWSIFYKFIHHVMAQSQYKGALPILYAATVDVSNSSELIGPDGFMEIAGYPEPLSYDSKALDEDTAEKLWKLSEQLTNAEFNISDSAQNI